LSTEALAQACHAILRDDPPDPRELPLPIREAARFEAGRVLGFDCALRYRFGRQSAGDFSNIAARRRCLGVANVPASAPEPPTGPGGRHAGPFRFRADRIRYPLRARTRQGPAGEGAQGRAQTAFGLRRHRSVIALTEAQAKARGYGTKPTPDAQPDKGWDYHPAKGQDEALRKVIQERRNQCGSAAFARKKGGRGRGIWCDNRGMDYLNMLAAALDSAAPMPPPRQLGLRLLDVGMSERQYLETFMREFGAHWNETAMLKDKTGYHTLAVSRLMFVDHKTGKSKITKEGRAPYLLYLAKTVSDPDEIRLHVNGYGDRLLHLLSRYVVRGGTVSVLAVFKENRDVWVGWSGYQFKSEKYLTQKRQDTLIYRRGA
jgi:hypothetical protein